jgi:hypothetical protein
MALLDLEPKPAAPPAFAAKPPVDSIAGEPGRVFGQYNFDTAAQFQQICSHARTPHAEPALEATLISGLRRC